MKSAIKWLFATVSAAALALICILCYHAHITTAAEFALDGPIVLHRANAVHGHVAESIPNPDDPTAADLVASPVNTTLPR